MKIKWIEREEKLFVITHADYVGRSAWVGFASLSVCLFVRNVTQKRMIQKCSNLV